MNLRGGLTLAGDSSIAGKCDGDGFACSDSAACSSGGHGTTCFLPDFTVGSGNICWNNECKAGGWSAIVASGERYLDIVNGAVTQQGNVSLQGYHARDLGALAVQPPLAALKLVGGTPTAGTPTNAIRAESHYALDPIWEGNYYAVYGRAGADSTKNVGVYAVAGTDSQALAGKFAGNVAIHQQYDLLIGGTRTDGVNPGVGELCINDDCRSAWPTAGTGELYWNDIVGYLQSGDSRWGFSMGGSGAGAPFYLESVPSKSQTNFTLNGVGKTLGTLTIQ